MTTIERPSLLHMLDQVSRWDLHSNCLYPVTSQQGTDWFFTKEELDAIHPVLMEMIVEEGGVISSAQLKMCLEYCARRPLSLFGATNIGMSEKHQEVKYFVSFSWQDNSDYVLVKSQCYDTMKTLNKNPYPIQVITNHRYVASSWLDENYPDWKERVTIAQSLNLDPPALTAYLIDTPVKREDLSLPSMDLM